MYESWLLFTTCHSFYRLLWPFHKMRTLQRRTGKAAFNIRVAHGTGNRLCAIMSRRTYLLGHALTALLAGRDDSTSPLIRAHLY